MDLEEIIQYKHKIKTIQIHNENKQSTNKFVVVKINISSTDDETIRFSLKPNEEFIEHQHIADTDDYYCLIPNILNTDSFLYAHFLPNDLYEYENESETLVNIYDLKKILEENNIVESNRYNAFIDEDDTLVVQSTDDKSINNTHDPNYKQYIETNNINKTQQGYFPLSSKYRTNKNWEVPTLTDAKPYWKNNNDAPYWEAKIPFDSQETPIKVFINYEYLPTSREYHQHYFGFEGATTNNNTINVFEGTNVKLLDDKFGSKNNYRLINLSNPYSDKYSIYVPHEKNIPINLDEIQAHYINGRKSCNWHKNKCQNYYVYTPLEEMNNNNNYALKEITLTAGKYYSLSYYIYIPSYASIKSDEGYICIETDNETFKIDNAFLYKDKELRNQWIYHEVPFLATTNNTIKIVGPQTLNKTIDKDNSIYFIHLNLQEMVEYSPTLQYTNTSVRISEQDQLVFKSISNKEQPQIINPDNKTWENKNIDLPTPYNDIYINMENEKEVYYDIYTTNLYYIHPTPDNTPLITYDYDSTNLTLKSDDDTVLTYDNDIIYIQYNKPLTGVYGPGNNFTFKITNINGDFVTDGEIEAAIFMNKDTTSNINASEIKLTQKPTKVNNGKINFTNIDLTNLQPNTPTSNKYYIRLDYNSPCLENKKIIFKTLYLYKEEVSINNIKINGHTKNKKNQDIIKNGYLIDNINEIPIKIEASILDQNNQFKTTGYCELSINDKLNQSTIVDNGRVDFYLDLTDVQTGCQTIKIEYYREYYKSLGFIYFELCVDEKLDASKSIIPINIKILDGEQTKTLSDKTFEDNGIADDYNTHYWNTSSWVDRVIESDGSILSNTRSTSNRTYYPIPNDEPLNANNLNTYIGDCTIELDLIEYTGTSYIRINGDNFSNFYRSWSNLRCVGGEHIRIEIKQNTQSIFIDDEETPKWTVNNDIGLTPYNICFLLGVGASLKFKNLKIINQPCYSIDKNDTVLNIITTDKHSKFKIEVYKDNNKILNRNIYNKNNNSIVFLSHTEYNDIESHTYTIKTGNMVDEDNNIIEDLYYDYERTFIVYKNPT